MDSNPPQLTLTTDDETVRPLPTNVRIAQAMGWQVVNLSPAMLPHFILPDGEVLFFDEFTPDLDPVSWQMVERWMVENMDGGQRESYGLYLGTVLVLDDNPFVAEFELLTAPFSARCQAFLLAVGQ